VTRLFGRCKCSQKTANPAPPVYKIVAAAARTEAKRKAPPNPGGFFFFPRPLFCLALLLDTSLLAGQLAQVVDTCATHDTHLVDLDVLDVGRIEGEDTLDAHTVGNLADREHLGLARTLDLDNHAAETLHALLVTLDDLVRYGDRIACLELGHVGLALRPQLLVYELDDCILVHSCNFRLMISALNIAAVPGLPYRPIVR